LLLFCLLESALSLAFYVDDRLTYKFPDTRYLADTYDHAPWAIDYYAEQASIGMKWEPYVYWRGSAHRGRFINIDDRGIRATTSAVSTAAAVKIFMFGGSTMWGTGARDEFTIPSMLTRELARKGVDAAVTNFGQTGYVSNQERITLELELQQGHRPDLVIFYDGINDLASAWQQGVAGRPQNEGNRVREFNLSSKQRMGERARSVLLDVALGLSARRFAQHLVPRGSARADPVATAPATNDRLPQQVVQTYMSNVAAVRLLGERCGFGSLFYWQPTILDKPHLTEYEKPYRIQMARMEPLFRQTYDLIRQGPYHKTYGLRDLSLMLVDTSAPLFVDYYHFGETGNELVARLMVGDVLTELGGRSSRRAEPVC
jgi:lysophospholipase L1-like esterase